MKHLFLLTLCALPLSGAVAAPKEAKPAAPAQKANLKVLNYCPIAGEKLHNRKVGATTYKNYSIAFCCPGCPEEFASLSAKDKDAKIARIVAKQAKDEGKPKA